MSVTGIASSILSGLTATQSPQNHFQQVKSEFQQLGQDLQSGNLAQAQSDFTTLSKDLPGLSQAGATAGASTAANGSSSVAQAFSQLGQDLQSGNLAAAQTDYTNLQQDAQQSVAQQVGGHHHHHHASSSLDSSSSSQQTNPITQAFGQLAQSLQSGNLSGAQSAFSTLQSDLQQIGGFVTPGSGTAAAVTPAGSSLNVTV